MSELPEPTDENLMAFAMGDPETRAEFGKIMMSQAGDTYLEFMAPSKDALWARRVLPLKTTVLVNLTILSCLNRPHELHTHMVGSLRGGIAVEEIKEIILQIGFYVGTPAGVEATRALYEAMQFLDERGTAYRMS